MALLEIKAVKKGFTAPDGERVEILDIPALTLAAQEEVALIGASGSGKTTLLHLISGILQADAGAILLDGIEITALAEAGRDRFRAQNIGYIFQAFNLLQGLTTLENVLLAMMLGQGVDRERARLLLDRVGLRDRLHYRPAQLSTGQAQRVAVARALVNRPKLVLADEPTGNLDAFHARAALDLVREVCREHGAALLLVTHDHALAATFDRVVELAAVNRAQAAHAGATS